ncbi:unnamed protein product [Strongylus vulgaris]|uniref:Receptor L-domain domain-containing protein n=1 Tax=Strongylus vulgaris TaxID=40348 RepID=A0A3P7I5F9_STRVU|nr:unnamed protein product [Strongylus vulgaris]
MPVVKLVKDAELVLINNTQLSELPQFEIENGKRVRLLVRDNPQLDTTQLLKECERKRCSPRVFNLVQMPYSCSYRRPLPSTCKNVTDDIDITNDDISAAVEVLYGTLIVKNSNWTQFPNMKNLRLVEQRPSKPVLVIEDNELLRDLDALFDIQFSIRDRKTAVIIKNNPELCFNEKYSNNSFANRYAVQVKFLLDYGDVYFPCLVDKFKSVIFVNISAHVSYDPYILIKTYQCDFSCISLRYL